LSILSKVASKVSGFAVMIVFTMEMSGSSARPKALCRSAVEFYGARKQFMPASKRERRISQPSIYFTSLLPDVQRKPAEMVRL
jgi:hypothetical protein